MIIDQTVGESASSSGFTNQMQNQKSSSSGSILFRGLARKVQPLVKMLDSQTLSLRLQVT